MFWNTFINQSMLELLKPIRHTLQLTTLKFLVVDFRLLWIHATSFLVLMRPRSHFHSLLLDFPCQSQSFDEDVGELDEVEELVDKPGTTNGTWFDVSQWNFLPFLVRCGFWPLVRRQLYPNSSQSFPIDSLAIFGEMWFLTAGPVVGISMILAEFPERKNCRCTFKKHHRHEQVQFFDVYRCLFC